MSYVEFGKVPFWAPICLKKKYVMLPVRSITKGHGVSFSSMQMITNYLYNFPQSELNTFVFCAELPG